MCEQIAVTACLRLMTAGKGMIERVRPGVRARRAGRCGDWVEAGYSLLISGRPATPPARGTWLPCLAVNSAEMVVAYATDPWLTVAGKSRMAASACGSDC